MVKKQLREHKVKVHSIHTTSGLPYDGANVSIFAFEECQRKAAVEEIKKNICTLALLDGEIAVIHPGGDVGHLRGGRELTAGATHRCSERAPVAQRDG